jgi:hypothetical protein
LVVVSPSLSIPTILQDIRPPLALSDSSFFDIGPGVVPGKLYGLDAALKLINTFETGGATAHILLEDKASSAEKEAFVQLYERLNNSSLVRSKLLCGR